MNTEDEQKVGHPVRALTKKRKSVRQGQFLYFKKRPLKNEAQ